MTSTQVHLIVCMTINVITAWQMMNRSYKVMIKVRIKIKFKKNIQYLLKIIKKIANLIAITVSRITCHSSESTFSRTFWQVERLARQISQTSRSRASMRNCLGFHATEVPFHTLKVIFLLSLFLKKKTSHQFFNLMSCNLIFQMTEIEGVSISFLLLRGFSTLQDLTSPAFLLLMKPLDLQRSINFNTTRTFFR